MSVSLIKLERILAKKQMPNLKEQIKSLENRIQIVLTLLLFFPVVLDALFKVSTSEVQGSQNILSWGAVAAFAILNYLFFESLKKQLPSVIVFLSSKILWINIFSYIPVLILISQVGTTNEQSAFYFAIYAVSILIIMWFPILLSILFSGTFIYLKYFKN